MDNIENPSDWIAEIVAAVIVGLFAAGAIYRWLFGAGLSNEIMVLLIVVILTSLASVYGVDKIKQVIKLWR